MLRQHHRVPYSKQSVKQPFSPKPPLALARTKVLLLESPSAKTPVDGLLLNGGVRHSSARGTLGRFLIGELHVHHAHAGADGNTVAYSGFQANSFSKKAHES